MYWNGHWKNERRQNENKRIVIHWLEHPMDTLLTARWPVSVDRAELKDRWTFFKPLTWKDLVSLQILWKHKKVRKHVFFFFNQTTQNDVHIVEETSVKAIKHIITTVLTIMNKMKKTQPLLCTNSSELAVGRWVMACINTCIKQVMPLRPARLGAVPPPHPTRTPIPHPPPPKRDFFYYLFFSLIMIVNDVFVC